MTREPMTYREARVIVLVAIIASITIMTSCYYVNVSPLYSGMCIAKTADHYAMYLRCRPE